MDASSRVGLQPWQGLTTGNAAEMRSALTKLGRLPDDTVVYNGHEYTTGSAKFGLKIEPDNTKLKE